MVNKYDAIKKGFTEHLIIFDSPVKKGASAWIMHTPFALFLVSILKPKSFVELGVHTGCSYNAFCQAVKALKTGTCCYGIDTWKGDNHAGFYGEDVYERLLEYQLKEYSEFSYLLRMTFDEGLAYFSNQSIDLLHIDGLHTYEAVKHDFEAWLPKVSDKGVILLHDTMVREPEFGVWRLWNEIAPKYSSFNFTHGCGLGIVAVGSNVSKEFLYFLNEANTNPFYQKLFFSLGMLCSLEEAIREKDAQISHLERVVTEKGAALNHIYNSYGWRLLLVCYRTIDRILPVNTKRRLFARIILNALMKAKGFLVNVNKNSLRNFIDYFWGSPMVAKLKAELLGHDWIYNSDYFEKTIEGPAARSAGRIANSILNDFKATCVIDVGCGTGALLEALRDRGCAVFGLEYAKAALRYCRARRLNVAKFDLERDVFDDNRTFDVAVSMEVAEHLPEIVADRYVDLLTRLSRVVVFTAAPPGQGGIDHVNEQPPSYWITKFQQRGLEHAEELSQRWRESWKAVGDVEICYHKNLMIFRRVRAI